MDRPRKGSPAPSGVRAEARLSRAEWLGAALEALATRGVSGLSVERLARELGVTKGSFYWHFRDRDELLAAALEHWEQAFTERLIAGLDAIPDPRERLARLIGQVTRGGQSDRIHLALASDKLPVVRAALARVTARRIEFLQDSYAALGQEQAEARQSALLAYSAYIGLVHLRTEAPSVLPNRDAFQAYVAFVVARLVPPAAGGDRQEPGPADAGHPGERRSRRGPRAARRSRA